MTPHVGVRSSSKLCHRGMARLAERAFKKVIMILTSGMILLDQNTGATAKETTLLLLPPGQSSRGPDGAFVDHDDDSGRA